MPVRKYLTVHRPIRKKATDNIVGWEILPGAEKVEVWDLVTGEQQTVSDAGTGKVVGFHVRFLVGVARGCRVTFLSDLYSVIRVSDSPRLQGLELLCEPIEKTAAAR